MQTQNIAPAKTKEINVVAGLKVIETEYKVKNVIFEDEIVKRPVFVEEAIKVPVGLDNTLDTISSLLYEKIMQKILTSLEEKLDKAVTNRIKEIEVPTIVYKTEEKVVEVEKVNFRDVEVERPIFKDKEIINPVVKDVEVQNAILKNVEVDKPVFKDRIVINPVFEEIVIQKPKFVTKEITVIHPKYIDMKGNLEES